MDRFAQFAVAAADMALEDSGLVIRHRENAERVAVIVGSGIGGICSLEETHRKALEKGPRPHQPFFILQMIINMAPGYISMRHGLNGPTWSTNSACSTSAHAIGEALRGIQRGEFDVMLAGGAEAPITALGVGGFAAMKALSTRNDGPRRQPPVRQGPRRLRARRRRGHPGPGGVRARQGAAARSIYAELVGYGASSTRYHITAPAPGDEGAPARHAGCALQDAGCPRGHRLRQRPRHLDGHRRRAGDGGASSTSSVTQRSRSPSPPPSP